MSHDVSCHDWRRRHSLVKSAFVHRDDILGQDVLLARNISRFSVSCLGFLITSVLRVIPQKGLVDFPPIHTPSWLSWMVSVPSCPIIYIIWYCRWLEQCLQASILYRLAEGTIQVHPFLVCEIQFQIHGDSMVNLILF